jgi:hypothetical protein
MRRTLILMMLMTCAALAMPVVATGDDQTIPPEAHWTPTPPARSTVDVNRLVSLLVDKGDDHPTGVYPADPPTGVQALAAQSRQGVDLGRNRSQSCPEYGW